MVKEVFTVNGMKCNHCKMTVENALKSVDGVNDAVVNIEAKNVCVQYDERIANTSQLKAAVDNSGHFEMLL